MTQEKTDQVFVIKGGALNSLPSRSLREGILGSTLEEGLHKLIEQYPQIIPGAQIDPGSDDPPKFVLLCREMAIGSWSLDFLLVDQYGIPTLVEAKLVENPESRRAVVGQIIEYAANAANAWGEGRLRDRAAEYWHKNNKELNDVLSEILGENDKDIDDFWGIVEENLQRGKIRLIITTDELRPEVRQIIKYLNTETRNAEVLGLEIRCYGKDDASIILVPRLIGQTPPPPPKLPKVWSFAELQKVYGDLTDALLRRRLSHILKWSRKRGAFIESKAQTPLFGLLGKSEKRIMGFLPDGIVYCNLNPQQFEGNVSERDRFVDRLNALPIFDYDTTKIAYGKNSSAPINELNDEEFNTFMGILGDFCVGEDHNLDG